MRRRCAAALLALLLCAGAAFAEGLRPGVVSDAPIWTDRPVRIDRKAQSYERIAVERRVVPERLTVSQRVAALDSGSFRDGGRLYVLTGAVPVDPKRLCRGDDGAISACGQRARLELRRLIAGRTLTCAEDERADDIVFVTCAFQGRDVAAALVEAGAATAATAALAARQADAMGRRAGIWTDPRCRAAGRCPPQPRRKPAGRH